MLYLEAVKVEKYFSDRLILKFDDLKIYRGDKIGLIGANGAGKTTLLNILAGLVEPDRGFVKNYCNLAYIRQFLDEESVASDQPPGTFNLDGDRKSNICSGGEQTQVKIANALNGAPQLLLADEPTANLDYKHIKIFEQQLKKTDTIILVTHDRQLLDGLCNKTLEISDG
jgi:macrolide transport system ATP-binding/permease protein